MRYLLSTILLLLSSPVFSGWYTEFAMGYQPEWEDMTSRDIGINQFSGKTTFDFEIGRDIYILPRKKGFISFKHISTIENDPGYGVNYFRMGIRFERLFEY